jgi:hypothetical protein
VVFAGASVAAAWPAQARSLSLTFGGVEAPGLRVDNIRLAIPDLAGSSATLSVARVTFGESSWRDVTVRCTAFEIARGGVECARGDLGFPAGSGAVVMPIRFRWQAADGSIEATVEPSPGEIWHFTSSRTRESRSARLLLTRADVATVRQFLPVLADWRMGGRLNGEVTAEMSPQGNDVRLEVSFVDGRFSDTEGAHAGEKLSGELKLVARGRDKRWQWRNEVSWTAGEVYLAPIYLASPGVTMRSSGTIDGDRLELDALDVESDALGRLSIKGVADLAGKKILSGSFATGDVPLDRFAPVFLTPILDSIAGPKLDWSGRLVAAGEVRNNALVSAELTLGGVSIRETGGRYALDDVNARIPWREDASTDARVDIARATWGKLPLGPIALPLKLRGSAIRLAEARIPVLDGEIVLEDVRYTRGAERTNWRAAIAVTPVSMDRLTAALEWPRMTGVFSASIPGIHQDGSTIALDGALVVQVFDGFASVTDLRLIEPFGRLPRLFADVELRNLDLEALTRTFSFGSITGRIDGALTGLELAGMRPLRFDARIESSPGEYRKRISQRAVQNIGALGGAGAAAAIQRSVLRVFEEFSYGKLGMSCRLRDGLCEMGGVEAAQSGYVMVKGAGIPSINVIGYNRRVDWDELLARLKRVTEGNMKPVVK